MFSLLLYVNICVFIAQRSIDTSSKNRHCSSVLDIFVAFFYKFCITVLTTMWSLPEDQDDLCDVVYCERVAVAVKNLVLECQSGYSDDRSKSVEMSESSYSPMVPKDTHVRRRYHNNKNKHTTSRRGTLNDWEVSNIAMETQCAVTRDDNHVGGPLSSTFASILQQTAIDDIDDKPDIGMDSLQRYCDEDSSDSDIRTEPSGVESDLDPRAYQFSSGYSSCGSCTSSGSRLPPVPPTSFASGQCSPCRHQISLPPRNNSPVCPDSLLEDSPNRSPLGERLPCDGQESTSPVNTPQYTMTPRAALRHDVMAYHACHGAYTNTPCYVSPCKTPVNTPACCHQARQQGPDTDMARADESDATLFIEEPLYRGSVVTMTTPKSRSSLHTIGRKLKKIRKHFNQFGKGNNIQDPNSLKTLAIL